MKATTLLLALMPVAAAFVIGCSSTSTPTPATSGEPGTANNSTEKKLVVGFSQIGAESGWRTANTDSIKSEAEKRGIELKFSDAH